MFILAFTLIMHIAFASATGGSGVLASQGLPERYMVFVSPQKTFVALGSVFIINVSISVPLEIEEIQGYELKLYYNRTMLEGVNIELPKDHFLTPKIYPEKIFIVECKFHDEEGYGYVALTQLSPESGNKGNGTVITATFKALLRGNATIEIGDVHLVTPTSVMIWPNDYVVVNGSVTVVPSDLNSDGKVDVLDLATAAKAFGSYAEQPRWNPIADINEDHSVDIIDLALIALTWKW